MDLGDHISSIKEALRLGQFVNEASISQGVVLRILQALGWPIFDSKIVAPEFAVEGRRVDLALCHPPQKPLVFLEVKQAGKSEGADRQLFEYAFHMGVPMAVLTDGQEWHFYLPGEQGDYQERRVYKLDLLERSKEECQTRLQRYLGYERLCVGTALETARRDYKDVTRERQIRSTLPLGWAKLIEESDDLVIELLADKVESLCGFKPDKDTVAVFLIEKARSLSTQHLGSPHAPTPVPAVKTFQQAAIMKELPSVGFVLHGRQFTCRNARDVMTKVFEELSTRDPTFPQRFASRPHSRKRRFLAKDKIELYPDRPDLGENHSHQLSSGWWLGTNYSKQNILGIIQLACEVAGLKYGIDLKANVG